jgi:hypothetical protein
LWLVAIIDMPKFPIRSVYIYRAWGNEVSFTAKVLAAVGDACTADILKEVVRTVCMERNMCYRGWHQCLVVGCRKYTL